MTGQGSNSNQTVSLLGCGWLGWPLARHLLAENFKIKGSTTSPEKVPQLAADGIIPYVLSCAPQVSGENLDDFFCSDILFLNIPFRRNLTDPHYYQQQIQSVVQYVEYSSVQWIIFASSTSVYPKNAGAVDENFKIHPQDVRAKVLLDVEHMVLNNKHFHATVIRFGGLYGDDRLIGRFLSGQKNLDRGNSPVNLIHLEDCVALTAEIIKRNITGQVFNAVSDGHPSRKSLYTIGASAAGLAVPHFEDSGAIENKIVLNHKIKSVLGYTFKYPDPIGYIQRHGKS